MGKRLRKIKRWLLWAVFAVVLFFVLQVSVLAFPSPWFDNSVREGGLTLYYDGPESSNMTSVLSDVKRRVEAVEIYDEEADMRVFVCENQRLYNVFARLALVPTSVPGFNLSVFDNSFVSAPRINDRRFSNYARVEHSALAGDLAQSIAHELVHDFMQEKLGFLALRRRKIPAWKVEGYAEYGANKAAIIEDRRATLADRITIEQTRLTDERARQYYQWGLIVEYLSNERGYSFADIMSDGVTLDGAREQMMVWYREQS